MSRHLSRAALARVTLLALEQLDGALRRADNGPIEPNETDKLALAVLALSGLSAAHQVRTIWKILRHEGVFNQLSCRTTHFGAIAGGIRHRAKGLGPGKPRV